jgi:predicted nucleotidyltransferase
VTRERPELPADIALLLDRLRDALLARGGLVGVYLYGSLVTGDYSPARSDIDVLVMVEREPDEAAISELRELHTALASAADPAGRLHTLYVSAQDAADPALLRTYWYGDRMTQWQVKLLTQAEPRPGSRCTVRGRRRASGRSRPRTSRRPCERRSPGTGAGSPVGGGAGSRTLGLTSG